MGWVGGEGVRSEGMELGFKGFKSQGWGRRGQRSLGVGVDGVVVGVGGVWVKGSGWDRRAWGQGLGSGSWGWVGEVREFGVGGIEIREVGIRKVGVGGLRSKESGPGGLTTFPTF